MVNVQIVCVGNIKEKFYTEAIKEYAKRLQAFCKFEIVEIKESKLQKENIQEITQAINNEGKEILKRARGYCIALCIEGKSIDSESFAKHIDDITLKGNSQITL